MGRRARTVYHPSHNIMIGLAQALRLLVEINVRG
jgi:hypothetical protein